MGSNQMYRLCNMKNAVAREASRRMSELRFVPFKSFVDAGFFKELSDKKLNEQRLSETQLDVYATYDVPIADDKEPRLSMSATSFGRFEDSFLCSSPSVLNAPGTIINLNTIESFKEFDKQKFIHEKGLEIEEAIKDGSIFNDPSLLASFAILAFSDLKNYQFYYWFAFPAISVDWKMKGPIRKVEKEEKRGICDAVDNWREQANASEWGFFLLKQNEAGTWVAGSLREYKTFWNDSKPKKVFGFHDPSTIADVPGWPLRNYMYLLSTLGIDDYSILAYRDHLSTDTCRSLWLDVSIAKSNEDKVIGWERNSNGKLAPKFSDLGSLINPRQLADQAVDLNLKLMKWRIAPSVDLEVIKSNSCLLLGAGTLGSYVSRALLGWGVRKITFVDSGKVSYSNPVRQSLYKFEDCKNGGVPKAERAAEALKEIYPSVEAEGHKLDIPMLGHPLTNETQQREDHDKLVSLIEQHDTIFLLMDSRESRWLPTVIGCCKQKLVINVALGFDSYVVLRHGVMDPKNNNQPHLGCYFCNDVVAPIDSVSNQTLDQMCTVTRPGVSMLASSSAVELFSSILQHPLKALAPANETSTNSLSDLPHQLRGFLHNFETMKIWGPSYSCCSACSQPITAAWNTDGWFFVKRALKEPGYVEELSGLAEVQRKADQLDIDTDWADSDNSDELV